MKKVYFFAVIFTFSCSTELQSVSEPKNIISKDTFVMLLKDLTVLESHIQLKYPTIQQSHKTVNKSSKLIFEKYNIDTARFNSSMTYYVSKQKLMVEIQSQIIDSVNRELTELTSK